MNQFITWLQYQKFLPIPNIGSDNILKYNSNIILNIVVIPVKIKKNCPDIGAIVADLSFLMEYSAI